jgi:colicin import membrane protein
VTTGRFRRRNASFRPTGERRTDRENNFFLGMVGCSLAIHLIAAAIFSHNPTSTIPRRPPTVYVDLVTAPVANPQRGSAGVIRKIATPVAPLATPPQPAVPAKVAKEQVVVKGKETEKTAEGKDDDGLAAAMAKMKQRKAEQDEQNEAQAAIAALKKKKTTSAPAQPVATAVGSASGTGDEAGSAVDEWLQSTVKKKWSWPDRKQKNLSAEVEVTFDVAGKLIDYKFIRSSLNSRFDDSLKRALFSLEPLPKPLRKPFKETILFNLEDLQGQ